jgi:hypothetical protein
MKKIIFLKITIAYVYLVLLCPVGAQQISDKDVIDLKIDAYVDFSKKLLYFRLISDKRSLLIELPGSLLDLDSNLNNDLTCIHFTNFNQPSWLKAVGSEKPRKIQGINIQNFSKTENRVEKNGSVEIRVFLYIIDNNKIEGPRILKNSIKLRKIKENDLDDSKFYIIPLQK